MKYTKEQVAEANSVPIKDILDYWGEKCERNGTGYRWKKHDSLVMNGCKWYRFSENTGGRAVMFVEKFGDLSYLESITFLIQTYKPWLLTNSSDNRQMYRNKETEKSVKKTEENQLNMPIRSRNDSCIKKYLICERCIEPTVVHFFISTGSLYEMKNMHNAVFVGRDISGFPRHVHMRGTLDEKGKYRKTLHGSDSRFAFGHFGGGDKLYVFEAPIDLMSFVSIYQKDWQEQNYISLCGISKNAIIQSLLDYPNIKEVVLCLDNDEAGHKASENINTYLKNYFDVKVSRILSQTKDWNEDLQNIKGFVMYSEDSEKNEETEEEEWGQSQY